MLRKVFSLILVAALAAYVVFAASALVAFAQDVLPDPATADERSAAVIDEITVVGISAAEITHRAADTARLADEVDAAESALPIAVKAAEMAVETANSADSIRRVALEEVKLLQYRFVNGEIAVDEAETAIADLKGRVKSANADLDASLSLALWAHGVTFPKEPESSSAPAPSAKRRTVSNTVLLLIGIVMVLIGIFHRKENAN